MHDLKITSVNAQNPVYNYIEERKKHKNLHIGETENRECLTFFIFIFYAQLIYVCDNSLMIYFYILE